MWKRLVQVAVLALCLSSFAGFASAQVYTGALTSRRKTAPEPSCQGSRSIWWARRQAVP